VTTNKILGFEATKKNLMKLLGLNEDFKSSMLYMNELRDSVSKLQY